MKIHKGSDGIYGTYVDSIQECVLINYFTFAMYSRIYSVLELIAFRLVMNELAT